jgi:hypothetical protein
MNRSIIRRLGIAALVAYPASALGADQAPDVKGKWIGKTHTILVGKGGHWPKGQWRWLPERRTRGAVHQDVERGLLVGLARDAAVAYAHVHNEMLRGRIADLESELSRVSAAAVSASG